MSTALYEPVGLPALAKGGIFYFSTIANLTAPKVSEATLNLTCVPDAGWEPTYEQTAGSKMKYCSDSEFEVPGKGKWTGGTFTYEWDPQEPDDVVNYKHVTTLTEGSRGYLGQRLGLDKDVALAAGDVLALLIPVYWGKQVPVPIDPSTDGQLLQLAQRYFITGRVLQNVAVVAGP
jgi:hypothetical protein